MYNDLEIYNLKNAKKFLRNCEDHKFECFYKLIMVYQLSRFEILNLEWSDIDFEKNTITIQAVSYARKGINYYNWDFIKNFHLKRIFPLLPHLKSLLLNLRKNQLKNSLSKPNYNFDFQNFVCVKNNGSRLNANTLSRNLKYISRKGEIPEVKISGIKKVLDELILQKSTSYDYYRCWTRFDIEHKRTDIYLDFDLFKNKKLIAALDEIIERKNNIKSLKNNQEM